MKKMDTLTQIIIAFWLNFLQTAACLVFGIDMDILATAALSCVAYIIFAQVTNKGYMPWLAYLGYVGCTAVQIALNYMEVIPPDGGFLPGLGQFIYCIMLVGSAGLLGAVNLIRFIVFAVRKNSAERLSDTYAADCDTAA